MSKILSLPLPDLAATITEPMQDCFPIGVLEALSGVPATTLRAWENRYGLMRPTRTQGGHRSYTSGDLDRVRHVLQLQASGLSIGEAARRIVSDGAVPENPDSAPIGVWSDWRHGLLRAIESFDDAKLDALYNESLSLHPMDQVVENLLRPVMRSLGERWREREGGIAAEHFFSAYLRNKLGSRLHHEMLRPRGKRLLAACVPGEFHEIGLLLFVLGAIGRGYRTLYLGASLPLEQIPLIVEKSGIAGVVLSRTVVLKNDQEVMEERERLMRLGTQLKVPLLLGGEFRNIMQNDNQNVAWLGVSVPEALARLEAIVPAHRI